MAIIQQNQEQSALTEYLIRLELLCKNLNRLEGNTGEVGALHVRVGTTPPALNVWGQLLERTVTGSVLSKYHADDIATCCENVKNAIRTIQQMNVPDKFNHKIEIATRNLIQSQAFTATQTGELVRMLNTLTFE